VPLYAWQAIERLKDETVKRGLWNNDITPTEKELHGLASWLEGPFGNDLFLWQRSRDSLQKEMDTVVHMPGWGNIWTQPIINRVNMLATGVRTMIGVKVFGRDLDEIQKLSEEIAVA